MEFGNTTELMKQVLEAKRRDLIHDIRLQTDQLNIGEGEHDPVDQGISITRRDQTAGFVGRLSRLLAQVERSLEAISDGSYGLCLECEEPIAAKRFKAIPWSSHCIRCQEMLETRQVLQMPQTATYQEEEQAA
jgi:DnaK suppressor protein